MMRYYLHQRSADHFLPDNEGTDLPNLDAARRHAIVGLRSLIADAVLRGELVATDRIEIADEDGYSLASVGFGEAVQVSARDVAVIRG